MKIIKSKTRVVLKKFSKEIFKNFKLFCGPSLLENINFLSHLFYNKPFQTHTFTHTQTYTHTHTHTHISSSSSCHAISPDIPDTLSSPLPIVHCFRQIFRAASRIGTKLLCVAYR